MHFSRPVGTLKTRGSRARWIPYSWEETQCPPGCEYHYPCSFVFWQLLIASFCVSLDSSIHASAPHGNGIPGVDLRRRPAVCRKILVAVFLPSGLCRCASMSSPGLLHICSGAWGKLSCLRAGNSLEKSGSWRLWAGLPARPKAATEPASGGNGGAGVGEPDR